MTLSKIKSLIELQKRPYISLMYRDGHQFQNAGQYHCENLDKETSSIEDRIQSAKTWLDLNVDLYKPNTVFLIRMKVTPTATGGGISGPYEFMFNDEEVDKAGAQPIQGLGAIQENLKPPAGYVHESELKAAILQKELDFEKRESERKLKEIENRFNDKLESVMESTKDYSPEKLTQLANAIGAIFGKNKGANAELSGTEKEPTLKEMAAQEFAAALVEKLPLSEIQRLKNQVLNLTEEKEVKQETNEPQIDE